MAQKEDKIREKAATQSKTEHKAEHKHVEHRHTEVKHSGLGYKLKEFKNYLEESKAEIKKVVWPTRKETVQTSIVVLALVVAMSIFLGIIDLGLTKIVELILS